jgi:hypothetical protein
MWMECMLAMRLQLIRSFHKERRFTLSLVFWSVCAFVCLLLFSFLNSSDLVVFRFKNRTTIINDNISYLGNFRFSFVLKIFKHKNISRYATSRSTAVQVKKKKKKKKMKLISSFRFHLNDNNKNA